MFGAISREHNPNPLFSTAELSKLRELAASDPWLLPKLILASSGIVDSKPMLIAAGFELEDADGMFYRTLKVPEGWTRKSIPSFTVQIIHQDNKRAFFMIHIPIPDKEEWVWLFVETTTSIR